MKKFFFSITLAILTTSVLSGCDEAGPLVILVRHAEKQVGSADPDLTQKGEQRALQLASILRDVEVSRLFCTSLKRTQQTLAPLEKALGKKCDVLDPKDVDGLVNKLRGLGAKEVAVVAGHSNTLGPIAHALGAEKQAKLEIAHDDYDGMFFVHTTRKGVRSLQKLHVGPANPIPSAKPASQ